MPDSHPSVSLQPAILYTLFLDGFMPLKAAYSGRVLTRHDCAWHVLVVLCVTLKRMLWFSPGV